MSNVNYIITLNIPYDYQRKERSFYCNLLEHTILYALIVFDTYGQFGFEGLVIYLMPKVIDWYLFEMVPSDPRWFPPYIKRFLYINAPEVIIEAIKRKLKIRFNRY